ncbi:MAG: hypothetical protein FJ387_02320 [Verrucomicrobia bacterium]|nr:hypothetical protein [Verrucomicrobiota bacterium]
MTRRRSQDLEAEPVSHGLRRLDVHALGWAVSLALAAWFGGGARAELQAAVTGPATPRLTPVVEVEEDLYRYEPADNGAGPMWCHGSTCLVRLGDMVYASGLETLAGVKPLNNCRWTLWRRDRDGWKLLRADPVGRTREPCPLVALPGGRVVLSANPTLTPPNTYAGAARPELHLFRAGDAAGASELSWPVWDGQPAFTEHSYRSFAADGGRGELLLFQNIGYTHAEWSFRDREGQWAARGQLQWPWGAEYDKPQPIRICYPNVALVDGAVHFVGVSDIVEPYARWRAFKKELTGREWDYDFRRLFYTWSPDIRSGKFAAWVELATRDKTCGWVSPGDLWVAPDGRVHVVWTERALDERLREKFFPGERQRHELNYAVLREGTVVGRRTLMVAAEGESSEVPHLPRFHPTPDQRLLVFFYVSGADARGARVSENRLVELLSDGSASAPVKVPLQHPLSSYFTATPRAGSTPAQVLDLLGTRVGSAQTVSYARVKLGWE